MVMGGSLGSVVLNDAIRGSLEELLTRFNIIHLCGKDKLDPTLNDVPGYRQYEYVKKELTHMFALADILISRAGANAISEICALSKPNLLIPLSAKASRGDQVLNARSFAKQGFSMVLEEEELTPESFTDAVSLLYTNRQQYIDAMNASPNTDAVSIILSLIHRFERKSET